VPSAKLNFEDLLPEQWASEADRVASELDGPLMMARFPGPAPEGWIVLPRGYARPVPAPPEALEKLTEDDHAAMRGLYGLFAGRYPGMLARENPEEWEERLKALANPMGVFEGERLLLWLAERDGELLELSAAPDALSRIPGALAAAGITRAPAPIAGAAAEWVDEAVKLRLIRPFHIPGERIESPEQLARALDGAVQWG
jgi:hypothetical protein